MASALGSHRLCYSIRECAPASDNHAYQLLVYFGYTHNFHWLHTQRALRAVHYHSYNLKYMRRTALGTCKLKLVYSHRTISVSARTPHVTLFLVCYLGH